MTEDNKEKGSFATKEDLKNSEDFQEEAKKAKKIQQAQAQQNKSPLIQKMDDMIKVMKDHNQIEKKLTEAMTALITISTSETREYGKDKVTVHTQIIPAPQQLTQEQSKEVVFPDQIKKSYETKSDEIEQIKMMFPEDLENLLSFEEKDNHIIIKPRQFLGSDNFAKIASIIRGIGGDYVSAGRDSHFRVQITKKEVEHIAEQSSLPLPSPAQEDKPPEQMNMLEIAQNNFPKDLAKLLDFTDEGDHIKVKPRRYLTGDSFGRIAAVVRELGGNYISAGKDTHFKLPKKQ